MGFEPAIAALLDNVPRSLHRTMYGNEHEMQWNVWHMVVNITRAILGSIGERCTCNRT